MIRRPPRSTLFPTRRSSDLSYLLVGIGCSRAASTKLVHDVPHLSPHRPAALVRSEEHTSELQSRSDLVCRLLLEKKKKIQKTSRILTDYITAVDRYRTASIP